MKFILVALLFLASPAMAQDVIGWKDFPMPTSIYTLPKGFNPHPSPLGPFGTAGNQWFQTNIPANATFVKQYNETAVRCTFIVDVHPASTNLIFVALQIYGPRNLTGFILSGSGLADGVFTLAGEHTFGDLDQLAAGTYTGDRAGRIMAR